MAMRNAAAVTVNFVHRRLARGGADAKDLDESAIATDPRRFVGGRNSWVVQSFVRLRRDLEARGHAVCLSDRTIPGTLCVIHRDDANDFAGNAHRSFLVVIRADRAPVTACDFAIAQNGIGLARHERFIPLWPQPGLLPRDPARGARVRRLVYQGRVGSPPAWFFGRAFHVALARRGISFEIRTRHWEDYRTADVAIAAREEVPIILSRKPATKVYNAWHAGVPVLAMPEPAYLELRRSPLDLITVNGPEEVLGALDRLNATPALYREMVENGRRRAREFSVDAIRGRWLELFDREFIPAFEESRGRLEWRRLWFLAAMTRQKVLSRAWRATAFVQRRRLQSVRDGSVPARSLAPMVPAETQW
jgi:hypothetical protein